MRLRTKEQNSGVRPCDVKKYHVEVSKGFDMVEIKKLKAYLRFSAKRIINTIHHERRKYQKGVPNIPFWVYMKYGECFEYKMVGDELFRFAVRLKGNTGKEDYIAVFQPQFAEDGELEVVIITCYANNAGDKHFTLRAEEYVA